VTGDELLTEKFHELTLVSILVNKEIINCSLSESFVAPTNAQYIYIKTLKFFTLKYITIAPTCFGFD